MGIFAIIVKNDLEAIELSTFWWFISVFGTIVFIVILDKFYYRVSDNWGTKIIVTIEFFKKLLQFLILITVTDLLSNAIAQKDIVTFYCEIESIGIKILILAVIIFFICLLIYQKYRLYKSLRICSIHYLITASKEDLQKTHIRFTCLLEQYKRKLSIILKFVPSAIIVIILENILGMLKNSDVVSTINYIMTNQANIYTVALLAGYSIWIYNTNENIKLIENKIRDINLELFKRESKNV